MAKPVTFDMVAAALVCVKFAFIVDTDVTPTIRIENAIFFLDDDDII